MFSDYPQLVVFINPHSGGYRHGPTQDLMRIAGDRGHIVHTTVSLNDLTEKVSSAYEAGHRDFVFAGGDGSWNKAINTIHILKLPFDEVRLGLLPMGTGNDWANMYGLSKNPEVLIHAAEQQKSFICPLAEVKLENPETTHVFANIAGMGFDSLVARQVEKSNKRNKLIYLRKVIANLPKYKAQSMKWSIDGEENHEDVFSLHVGIGQSSGGGLKIMPNTPLFPEMLSVTEVLKASTWDYGKALPKLIRGKIDDLTFIRMKTAERVSIFAHELDSGVEVDGEWIGSLPCHITISANRLHCVDNRA